MVIPSVGVVMVLCKISCASILTYKAKLCIFGITRALDSFLMCRNTVCAWRHICIYKHMYMHRNSGKKPTS